MVPLALLGKEVAVASIRVFDPRLEAVSPLAEVVGVGVTLVVDPDVVERRGGPPDRGPVHLGVPLGLHPVTNHGNCARTEVSVEWSGASERRRGNALKVG